MTRIARRGTTGACRCLYVQELPERGLKPATTSSGICFGRLVVAGFSPNAVQLSECRLTVGAVYDRTILLLSSTFLDCEERRAVIDRAYSSATLTLTEQDWL